MSALLLLFLGYLHTGEGLSRYCFDGELPGTELFEITEIKETKLIVKVPNCTVNWQSFPCQQGNEITFKFGNFFLNRIRQPKMYIGNNFVHYSSKLLSNMTFYAYDYIDSAQQPAETIRIFDDLDILLSNRSLFQECHQRDFEKYIISYKKLLNSLEAKYPIHTTSPVPTSTTEAEPTTTISDNTLATSTTQQNTASTKPQQLPLTISPTIKPSKNPDIVTRRTYVFSKEEEEAIHAKPVWKLLLTMNQALQNDRFSTKAPEFVALFVLTFLVFSILLSYNVVRWVVNRPKKKIFSQEDDSSSQSNDEYNEKNQKEKMNQKVSSKSTNSSKAQKSRENTNRSSEEKTTTTYSREPTSDEPSVSIDKTMESRESTTVESTTTKSQLKSTELSTETKSKSTTQSIQ